MMTLLLVALLAPQESVADQVRRLARDRKANREAILELGPVAIRPLLEIRSAALEGLIDELRAGSHDGVVQLLQAPPAKAAIKEAGLDEALKALLPGSISFTVDPALAAKNPGLKVSIAGTATLGEALRAICAKANGEYGWCRRRLVLSTPDRLWPVEPPKRPPLKDPELAALKKAAARLGDESIEARDRAARDIAAFGASALPHLEELLKAGGGPEREARLRALIGRLARSNPAPLFADRSAIESQELDAMGRKVLEILSKEVPFQIRALPLKQALTLLLSSTGAAPRLNFEDPGKLSYHGENEPMIDTLFFLTAPYGLDACWSGGGLIIGKREAIAEAMRAK